MGKSTVKDVIIFLTKCDFRYDLEFPLLKFTGHTMAALSLFPFAFLRISNYFPK